MWLAGIILSALQAPAASGDLSESNRASVTTSLSKAQMAADVIGYCTEIHPSRGDWEVRFQAVWAQVARLRTETEDIYPNIGSDALIEEARARRRAPRCSSEEIRSQEVEATVAVAEAERLIAIDAAPRSQGLWIGNLQLCRERLVSVTRGGESPTDVSRLEIRFSDAFAPRIEALTSGRVGQPLGVWIDGMEIVRPIVMEPIRQELSLDLPSGVPMERLLHATATDC